MLHLRNINPMVRAVGTMGAVSALVGGITFAQLTSNTVALSPNTLSTGSANLEIGTTGTHHHHYYNSTDNNTTTDTSNTTNAPSTFSTNTNDNTDHNTMGCNNTTNGSVPGFNLTGSNGLLPGVTSSPLDFCLKNTNNVPLSLTVGIPQAAFASDTGIPPSDVTLHITCDNGGTSNGTLDQYTGGTPLGTLAAGATTNCAATVTLSSSFSSTTNESVPSFDIQFVGTTGS